MQKAARPRLIWSLIGSFWLVLGLLTYLQTYLYYLRRPSFNQTAVMEMATMFTLLWAVTSPIVLWLARRFPLERSRLGRHLLIHLAAAIVLGCTNRLLFLMICERLPYIPPEDLTPYRIFLDLIFHLDNNALLYLAILAFHEIVLQYFRMQDALERQSQLEAQLVRSQLQALKMQLHPHFLFNTLHTISSMIHIDPDGADLMVVRLSEFLRLALESQGVQEVQLEQELRFIRRYLEIERIRFAERLQVEYEVDEMTLGATVPNLILQPLVENAIRHGLSRSAGKGRIAIRASAEGQRLILSVMDNGVGLTPRSEYKEGVGLRNTRARLSQLYGDEQELRIRNRDEGGVEAVLSFPL